MNSGYLNGYLKKCIYLENHKCVVNIAEREISLEKSKLLTLVTPVATLCNPTNVTISKTVPFHHKTDC